MSTRCLIANQQPDSVRAIYCHHDGYPDGVGRILFEHYRCKTKVEELINLGDLSSLGKNIGPEKPVFDDYGFQKESTTAAYYRDRDEDTIVSHIYRNREEMSETCRRSNEEGYTMIRYLYYFQDGQWYCSDLWEPDRWNLLECFLVQSVKRVTPKDSCNEESKEADHDV